MYENFKICQFKPFSEDHAYSKFMHPAELLKVMKYHQGFAEYCKTPLRSLKNTAAHLGVADFYVKDESYRFGLNAFKVLGASYAIGHELAERLSRDISEIDTDYLASKKVHDELGDLTFITATDGNHGRGVAWSAAKLGFKSIVKMPRGTAPERLENIKKLGSDAEICDLPYDDCVRLAEKLALENENYILVQDTSWPGYEKIPALIMQGYATLFQEAVEEFERLERFPTHIFLQAGVGSMPGAAAAYFAAYFKEHAGFKPVISILEPNKADCIFRTAQADDGKMHFVKEEMNTIMAGLACGEPNECAYNLMRENCEFALSCPDFAAAHGMRLLANPYGDDQSIISGESGASAAGFAALVCERKALSGIREKLGIDENSRIFCISTEGATDRVNYADVVIGGKYPSYERAYDDCD